MNRKLTLFIVLIIFLFFPSIESDGALSFNAASGSDAVTFGTFTPNVNTVSFWLYTEDYAADAIIFGGQNVFNSTVWQWGVFWYLNTMYFEYSTSNFLTLSSTQVPLNAWEHFVFVRDDGTESALYMNGKLMSTGSQGSGNDVLRIANANQQYSTFIIDDVRLYNRALTTQEIASLANSRSRLNITDGLVAYFRMDEGVDGAGNLYTPLYDSSHNTTAGTIVTGTWKASNEISYP